MQRSIKNRLMMSFGLMVVLPVLFMAILGTTIFWISTNRTLATQGEMIVSDIESQIKDHFARYDALLAFLERDDSITAVAKYASLRKIPPNELSGLEQLLAGYGASVDGVDKIALAYTSGNYLCTEHRLLHPVPIQIEAWMQPCLDEPEQTFYLSYSAGQNPMLASTPHYTSSIAVCRAICDEQGQPIAVANLTIRGESLGAFLTSAYGFQGGQSYLATMDGTLVNSPLHLDEVFGVGNNRFLETRRIIEGLPLTIINLLPNHLFNTQQYMTLIFGISSIFILMLIFTLHVRDLTKQILLPIDDLRQQMQKAQHGDLNVAYYPGTEDEFGDLAESFNQMVSEIRHLIDQVYYEQSSKRKAEIAALQATIKPHFLYNTLETIHWMARRYGADDIVEAVDALSDLFHVGFSSNHELGTVGIEFTHIESYLKIQKLRYADILDYVLELEPGIRDLPLQKTILQPIVENALYHGIKESGRPGRITITAGTDTNGLLLTIRDNGCGMSPDALGRLRDRLTRAPDPKAKHGIGLQNVQQRLVLGYGPPYGLTIESTPNVGTIVQIHHPILAEQLNEQLSEGANP